MILQISSGQGPEECELAVGKLYDALKREYADMTMLSCHKSRRRGGFTSILCSAEQDLSHLEGSVQWICRSPFRPNHKRKNWFIDVSVIPEAGSICKEENIQFERFHCGGNGGQNVNKVETGVRLRHIPTGITVTSTSERSQLANRRDAMNKLKAVLKQKETQERQKQVKTAWQKHMGLVRGKPVRVYEGMEFNRRENGI